jgi:hypothetical protein
MFQSPLSCNSCGETKNTFIDAVYVGETLITETATFCEACGHTDHWKAGHFASGCGKATMIPEPQPE